jgi:hypothetical protein
MPSEGVQQFSRADKKPPLNRSLVITEENFPAEKREYDLCWALG